MKNEISELTHQKNIHENRRNGRKRMMLLKFSEEKDFLKAIDTAIDKFYDAENKKIDKEILNLEKPPKESIKKAEAKKLVKENDLEEEKLKKENDLEEEKLGGEDDLDVEDLTNAGKE